MTYFIIQFISISVAHITFHIPQSVKPEILCSYLKVIGHNNLWITTTASMQRIIFTVDMCKQLMSYKVRNTFKLSE